MKTLRTRYGRSLAPAWAAPCFGVRTSGAQMGLHKTSKPSQNQWFGRFLVDPFGETHLDHVDKKRVPMQRGAHFAFSGSVPMQRDARFGIFDVSWGGLMWPSEGVRNICKTNAFFNSLKTNRKRRVRQKRMREHSHAAW